MKSSINTYAKVGFAHFMLYPDCIRKEGDTVRTLSSLIERSDIERVDCCMPYDEDARRCLIDAIRTSGKEVGYAIHPFPIDKIALCSLDDHEQGVTRLALKDQLDVAAALGATQFTIGSGPDPGEHSRDAARSRFKDLCCWLCEQANQYNITVLLEPFDRDTHRRFLYGPTAECVELVCSLRPSITNLKIQLDIAHIRLSGEDFNEAIDLASDCLAHVHLSNCILKNTEHPLFGDRHPPIGCDAGEIDVPELAMVLNALLRIGYLDSSKRGSLIIESRPLMGVSVGDTITDQLSRLDQAWAML